MANDPPLVLVVEDEEAIRRITRIALLSGHFRVIEAENGCKGLAEVVVHHPDVLLLDLGLPDMSGLEVIRQLRDSQRLPIVVFTAGANQNDKIAALDSGAFDYVAKPFKVIDLLARLNCALRVSRRPVCESISDFKFGDLGIDLLNGRVTNGESQVNLTPRELLLLAALVRNAGRLMTYRFLNQEIGESTLSSKAAVLMTLISQLRHKLEPDPLRPRHLFAEPGVGYRFCEE